MSFLNKLRNNPNFKNWFAVEALPIWVIVGTIVTGGSWYLTRIARGPDVVWTKSNPQPWNNIKEGENTKLYQVNQGLTKSWTRDKL